MVDREKSFIISVLADHLAKRTTVPVSDLDWGMIYTLSQTHQIGGILWYQCREFIPSAMRNGFERMYANACFSYMNRKIEGEKLSKLLQNHGIACFTIKGMSVAEYYPVPALRTMGDLDLVIHREDREKANSLMHENGFQIISDSEDREWKYIKSGMEYELHDHLIYSATVNRESHEAFFNDFWPYVYEGRLDASFHLLFLLLHLRKHLMNTGVGFRQFMDIAVMAEKETGLNWPWIEEKLKELELSKFAGTCAAFIQKWFGITIPLDTVMPDESFFEYATEMVCANGLFGFENKKNEKNMAVNVARKNRYYKLEMLKNGAEIVFPSYQTMCFSPDYQYLKGKPALLPAAWVHRFIINIGRIGEGMEIMKSHFASEDQIKERNAYLQQWGL